jgi:Tol biopolymer transport system component
VGRLNNLQSMKANPFLILLALGAHGGLTAEELRPVSVRVSGKQAPLAASGISGAGEWSSDGRAVVFGSTASDLVAEPMRTAGLNVFLRRPGEPGAVLVSAAADGSGGGNGRSSFAQFAGSTNRIVFASTASNLVAADTNGVEDVFLRDLSTGITRFLSAAPDGAFGNGASSSPLVVAGRWVVFESMASNLDPAAPQGLLQAYIHDLSTGRTELAARGVSGADAAGTWEPRISEDGNRVAFRSRPTLLGPSPVAGSTDLFVRDRAAGTVVQLGVGPLAADVVSGTARVRSFDISPDGRFVAMVVGGLRFRVGNLINTFPVAVWHDLDAGTARVVAAPGGATPTDSIRLAEGGRRVFIDVLPAGETTSRVMAWAEADGLRSLESLSLTLPPIAVACTNSELVDVAGDGSKLLLTSPQELGGVPVSGLSGEPILYEWSVVTGQVKPLTAGQGGTLRPITGLRAGTLSPDGSKALWDESGTVMAGDDNRSLDVVIGPGADGVSELLSLRAPGSPLVTAGGASAPVARSVSGDGRWVLFTSLAQDLVEPPIPGHPGPQLFLRDQEAGVTRWITKPAAGGVPAPGTLGEAVLAVDGSRVFFSSTRADLVTGDTNGTPDVFLHDRASDALRALSLRSDGKGTGSGSSTLVAVDGTGQRVLFDSDSVDLVPGGTTGRNVYLQDVGLGTTVLLSTNGDASSEFFPLAGSSRGAALSEDGRWVALLRSSSATGNGELVVRDPEGRLLRIQPGLTSVSRAALASDGGLVAYVEGSPRTPSAIAVRRLPGLELVWREVFSGSTLGSMAFTPDSRRLLLATSRPLVASDTNGVTDVYLVGFADGTVDWVSAGIAGSSGAGVSDQPTMSRDGRLIVFRSAASNVAIGGASEGAQVVVRDHVAGITRMISAPVVPGVSGPAGRATVSGDGRSILFQSFASGLLVGDHNGAPDVYQVRLGEASVADSDQDGLPDAWELWNLGRLGTDGTEDVDGDGLSNLAEYRAGTHPANPASRLEVRLPAVTTDRVLVGWDSIPGVAYVVERAGDAAGPWTTLGRVDPSSGGVAVVEDAILPGALYRVRVPAPQSN